MTEEIKAEPTFWKDYQNLYLSAQRLEKKEDNPFYHSKYVQLKDVLAEAKRLCIENNFIFFQVPKISDDITTEEITTKQVGSEKIIIEKNLKFVQILETTLQHISGKEIVAQINLPVKDSNDPQKLGGALTYMRRYSLTSILGLEEEDQDGNDNAGQEVREVPIEEGNYKPRPAGTGIKKTCPVCQKQHTGPYPKCIDCWKAEQKPGKTKKVVNTDQPPFPEEN